MKTYIKMYVLVVHASLKDGSISILHIAHICLRAMVVRSTSALCFHLGGQECVLHC